MSLAARRQDALAEPGLSDIIQSARLAYEAGFAKASVIGPPQVISLGEVMADLSNPPHEHAVAYDHAEVWGDGDTFQDAMAEWRKRLAMGPQTGSELIWRVAPEFDCWCDFPSDKLVWKIYARIVIVL